MNSKRRLILVLGSLALVAAVFPSMLFHLVKPGEPELESPEGENKDISVLPDLIRQIRSRSSITLFEGLPHQHFENQLMEEELQSKETIKILGFPLYSEERSVPEDLAGNLVQLLAEEDAIVPWRGYKLCGGFHPDYALRFNLANGAYCDALLCFGCNEIQIVSGNVILHADLPSDGVDKLEAMLARFEKHRPKKITSGWRRRVDIFQTLGNSSEIREFTDPRLHPLTFASSTWLIQMTREMTSTVRPARSALTALAPRSRFHTFT